MDTARRFVNLIIENRPRNIMHRPRARGLTITLPWLSRVLAESVRRPRPSSSTHWREVRAIRLSEKILNYVVYVSSTFWHLRQIKNLMISPLSRYIEAEGCRYQKCREFISRPNGIELAKYGIRQLYLLFRWQLINCKGEFRIFRDSDQWLIYNLRWHTATGRVRPRIHKRKKK